MKWTSLVISLLLIGSGVYLFTNPLVSLTGLGWLFAISLIGIGASEIVTYFKSRQYNHSIWELLYAILTIAFGAILLFGPMFRLTLVLPTIWAYWLLFGGLLRFVAGRDIKRHTRIFGNSLISSGLLSVILGIIMLGSPLFSALVIGYLIAITLVYKGIECLILFFFMLRL